MELLEKLYWKMAEYYSSSPSQIQHFAKVHSYARLIGVSEELDAKTLLTLEAAAFVHDIGIKPAIEKYKTAAGPYQEKEGAPLAENMLLEIGFDHDIAARVGTLVGRHHTFENIDGPDCRILLEADMLVNLHEGKADSQRIRTAYETVFETESGKRLCRIMYNP